MLATDFLEFLSPGDSLQLRNDRLGNIRIRRWTFFGKLKKNKKDRLLLLHKGKPLTVKPEDIDWETYRK